MNDGHLRVSASDLTNFLACRHLTRLDSAAAHGLLQAPHLHDVGFDALVERGREHEARILEDFEDHGWEVVTVCNPFENFEQAAAETEAALASGVDVVYQGALAHEQRRGQPDFLVHAELLGGNEGYEVVDAKLARTLKARAVLQATFYSRLLEQALGVTPKRLHLALGGGTMETLDVADFGAYERQIHRLFTEFLFVAPSTTPDDTYPEPVEHCAICRWRLECTTRRRSDDDISLVAGITARERKALKEMGIPTRRGLASLDDPPPLDGVGRSSVARIHAQARIQVEGEDAGQPKWELIEPERDHEGELVPNRGLLALPSPAPGDLFFDIEGSRFYSENDREFGLQYLFGVVNIAEPDTLGQPSYRTFWAFSRAGEREAFEQLMDFLAAHLAAYPDAHIYHYNHYEPTAIDHLSELHLDREDVLRKLMGRFATREDDLDQFLRRRIFVDLYRVVRQGIRASVESYSLKRLEPLIGFERQVALEAVNERMVLFEIALDDATAAADVEARQLIAGYNEDDCRATLALRDWLERCRDELAEELGSAVPRPVAPEVPDDPTPLEITELRQALLAEVTDQESDRTPEERARVLMADLLEYHRREAKPAWWRYFHLLTLTDDELIDEPDAIAHLEFEGDLGPVKQSRRYRYRFPPQEHSFAAGDKGVDPLTEAKWDLIEVNDEAGYLEIRRGPTKLDDPHPSAIVASGPEYTTTDHRESLRALARRVLDAGVTDWPLDSAMALLLRVPPGDAPGATSLRAESESALDAGRRIALELAEACLPVQGPPGTGKTYLGANQIVDIVTATRPRKVGVTATSHAVISHMLDEVDAVAAKRGLTGVRIGQKPDGDERWLCAAAKDQSLAFPSAGKALKALNDDEVDVVGGTSWLWARPDFEGAVDVLIVDEAGQMSMADVLAVSRASRGLVLLGDPLQLAHPSQGSHPPTVPGSALDHILDGRATISDTDGLFIDKTRRMHPNITAFTSEVFYDGRLTGIEGLERQAVLCESRFAGSGLRVVDVQHHGNSNSSPEEAVEVATITKELLTCRWRNSENKEREMSEEDVLVVTPFNAQIREIHRAMDSCSVVGVQVGTVDKYQGRQAPVVIYSMASSSAEDAPRGMEFLYDLHRLNVATSRAQAVAIVVGSPDLVRVFCRTPRQMTLAGALCRLREYANAPT